MVAVAVRLVPNLAPGPVGDVKVTEAPETGFPPQVTVAARACPKAVPTWADWPDPEVAEIEFEQVGGGGGGGEVVLDMRAEAAGTPLAVAILRSHWPAEAFAVGPGIVATPWLFVVPDQVGEELAPKAPSPPVWATSMGDVGGTQDGPMASGGETVEAVIATLGSATPHCEE